MTTERNESLTHLGARLARAWSSKTLIEGPADGELPVNRDEAYRVQDAMAQALGQPLSGWKVGATSAKMRELDGHDDVIPGRIFQSATWQASTLDLPIAKFPNARVETEFAFRLSADLPLRDAIWTARELAPLATLHPAIEIIGNRHAIPDAPASTKSLMTIADNGGGIGFVFGDAVPQWQHINFAQHRIHLTVDDSDAAENFFGDMRCIPINAVADLANHLSQRGIALSSGDFVSTGAATVPQPIVQGSKVVADFGDLGSIRLNFI